MTGRLLGEKAIVTGAARGIGAAIARLFAAEGASLGLLDLDGDALGGIVEELRSAGAEVAEPGESDERIHVGAVHVDLPAGIVHRGGDVHDVLFVDAVRRGVRDHQSGQRLCV